MEEEKYDAFKIILWLILFLVFGIIIITCKSETYEYIMTVNGPIPPSEMGRTLEHEHVLVDFIGADSISFSHWNRDSVTAKLLPLLEKVKTYGVKTFCECTPKYLGRDPLVLKELSQKTGLNFLTNTGYYGAYNKYLPASMAPLDAALLADKWVEEFRKGIEGTGIKPGFIKIAVNPDDTLSAIDTKLITAAGYTHLATGLTIASHTGPENPAFAQIEILKKLGVDPSAFIWVHAQRGNLEANIEAAREGTWVSLDNVRYLPDAEPGSRYTIDWYADRILEFKRNGLLNKLLISHDSGWYDPSKPGGGQINGYTDIFEYLIPVLTDKGITQDELDQLLITNPANAFKIRVRKL
jgi:phosphotriesterase-related protein